MKFLGIGSIGISRSSVVRITHDLFRTTTHRFQRKRAQLQMCAMATQLIRRGGETRRAFRSIGIWGYVRQKLQTSVEAGLSYRRKSGGHFRCASGCVVECRICNREVAGSNLGRGYFAPRSTQPSIPPGSANEYQLRLGRQRQVWFIPIAELKSLENTCHTWALLRWWFTTKSRYIKCMHLLPLGIHGICQIRSPKHGHI